MTTTVFLSGSRKISRLDDAVRGRLKTMMDKGFRIVVGDANGADKALQGCLAEAHYDNVDVFCAGNICRNNVGTWNVRNIDVDPHLRGRDFYTQKDKAMALEADYGFVLWDGKSVGSINNVIELLKDGKSVVVYFAPNKEFHTLKQPGDIYTLLQESDQVNYRNIIKKTGLDRQLDNKGEIAQRSLRL